MTVCADAEATETDKANKPNVRTFIDNSRHETEAAYLRSCVQQVLVASTDVLAFIGNGIWVSIVGKVATGLDEAASFPAGIFMRAVTLTIILGLVASGPAFGQQKSSRESKARTCTYEQCVSVNKARGWDSAAVSRWCSANPGKCDN